MPLRPPTLRSINNASGESLDTATETLIRFVSLVEVGRQWRHGQTTISTGIVRAKIDFSIPEILGQKCAGVVWTETFKEIDTIWHEFNNVCACIWGKPNQTQQEAERGNVRRNNFFFHFEILLRISEVKFRFLVT